MNAQLLSIINNALPGAIDPSGQFNPVGLLSNVYESVELRTALTPTVRISLAQLARPGVSTWGPRLKPTILLHQKSGPPRIIAPYGEVGPNQGGVTAGLGLFGLLAVGFVAGRYL